MKKKTCKKCGNKKLLSGFYKHPGMKDGHLNCCKKCHNKINLKHQKSEKGKEIHNKACRRYDKTKKGKVTKERYLNSEKGKVMLERKTEIQVGRDLKRNYNITVKQYNQMLANQNGVCFLCKKPELDRHLGVDHNHETGEIRRLLCRRCNFLVGSVENNVSLIKQIFKYINR